MSLLASMVNSRQLVFALLLSTCDVVVDKLTIQSIAFITSNCISHIISGIAQKQHPNTWSIEEWLCCVYPGTHAS